MAVIVGTGAGGGILAYELAKENISVTVIEKGPYIKSKDGIPYLSYVKCYFADFDEYNKYYYHNDNKNCCTHLLEKILNLLILPFILFDKCFVFFLRSLILIFKISAILTLIFGLPFYYFYKTPL